MMFYIIIMNIIYNFSLVRKIYLVDEFCKKKAEKFFEAIQGNTTADFDSADLSINFLYNNGKFISSKFIPDSFDPKKILKKLNLFSLKYCLEPFGWQMSFKFEPLFVESTWEPFIIEHAYFCVRLKQRIIIVIIIVIIIIIIIIIIAS